MSGASALGGTSGASSSSFPCWRPPPPCWRPYLQRKCSICPSMVRGELQSWWPVVASVTGRYGCASSRAAASLAPPRYQIHGKLLPMSTGPPSISTTTTTATSGGVKLRSKSGYAILAIEARALLFLARVGSLQCLLDARCWARRKSTGGKEEAGEVLLL